MKNRKTVVVAFLLVAVMLLGVGYAALTDTLTIIGNATIDMAGAQSNFDANVHFDGAEFLVDGHGTGNKAEDQASYTADDATYQIHSLATLGEKAIMKFTIHNDSNVPVMISIADANPTNSNEEYFQVAYEYFSDEELTTPFDIATTPVASGANLYIKVTVSVKSAVTAQTTGSFGLALNVTTEIPTP